MYIDAPFLVFSVITALIYAVTILVAMEGKKIWQLNLQQKTPILRPLFGSHVPRCTKFFYQLVLKVFLKLMFSFLSMQKKQAVI